MSDNGGEGVVEMREPRRHVVMCAAACHPDLGSEFAVGWQWVTVCGEVILVPKILLVILVINND